MKREIYCPRCGRPEKGNVRQDDLILCGKCTILRLMKFNRDLEEKRPNPQTVLPLEINPPVLRPRKRINRRPAKKCGRCGGVFHPSSNHQSFCPDCYQWANNQRLIRHRNEKSSMKRFDSPEVVNFA